MAEKSTTPVVEATPADHVRVRVRQKGDGLISKGERTEGRHVDETFAAGDIVVLHKRSATPLLALDLVDEEA